jgi:hypothetical protein
MLVRGYLGDLRRSRKGKPQRVRRALEIYIDTWEEAIKVGLISPDETVWVALPKIRKGIALAKEPNERGGPRAGIPSVRHPGDN